MLFLFCFIFFTKRFIGNSHLLQKWSGRNKKRLRDQNSENDDEEPISALESFDSFCKVVDLGEKKRKLENGKIDRDEKDGKGLQLNSLRNGDNGADSRGRESNGAIKSDNSRSSSSSSSNNSDDNSDSDSDADSDRNKNHHISADYKVDEEEEEEVEKEEEVEDLKNNRISVLPRYQSDLITVAPSRPTKIDYSFIGDVGSRGVDGIAVRQPSIVRDLWAQVPYRPSLFLFEKDFFFLSSTF